MRFPVLQCSGIRRYRPLLEALEDRYLLSFNFQVDYRVGFAPTSVALGDFRNLHLLDMVVANSQSDYLAVLLNNGDGTFVTQRVYGVRATDVVVGDFNNDGNLDVVASDSDTNKMFFLAGNGDGTFQPPTAILGNPNPARMVTGYFDGTGNLDLAVVNPNADMVTILLGNGDGTFQAPIPIGGFVHPLNLAAGDFNNDNTPDLVVTNGDGNFLSILLGNGDGTFSHSADLQFSYDQRSVAVGDFNHDGNLDIAATNNVPNPNLMVVLGNGDGTFRQDIRHFFLQPSLAMTIGDFEQHGNLDIVETHWDHPGNGGVKLVPGHGDGTFGDGGSFHVGNNPMWIVAGDLNGDGYPDIVTANKDSNSVSVLINAADWDPPSSPAVPRGLLGVALPVEGAAPADAPAGLTISATGVQNATQASALPPSVLDMMFANSAVAAPGGGANGFAAFIPPAPQAPPDPNTWSDMSACQMV
jgi:hypothetical protein